eukprot:m.75339 g.75339  ORF g.75339 m.75339 type:complete len:717 (+) comp8077_c0_seq1:180-2330(+)
MSFVRWAFVYESQIPSLQKLDTTQPLVEIIESLCRQWRISNPEDHALKSDETQLYVTERNRVELKDGAVLRLAASPTVKARDAIQRIRLQDPIQRKTALIELSSEIRDVTFANKFDDQGGVTELKNIIESCCKNPERERVILVPALAAFNELVRHGNVDLVALQRDSPAFLTEILKIIGDEKSASLASALKIAAAVVYKCPDGFDRLNQGREGYLVSLAGRSDQSVAEGALCLINALIVKAGAKRDTLFQALEQKDILLAVQNLASASSLRPETCHELYLFQQLWLNARETRKNEFWDVVKFPTCERDLKTLRRNLPELDEDVRDRRPGAAEAAAARKLGFKNPAKPEEDFMESPGLLALDFMAWFASRDKDTYTKVVLDQLSRPGEYMCPFVQASKMVITILLELLNVGEEPSPTREDFLPLFYSVASPLRDMYCACIQLAAKTWREMEAKIVDFDKVMTIVRKQISLVLESANKPRTMDEFKNALLQRSYSDMMNLEAQRLKAIQSLVEGAVPVVNLKNTLRDELMEVVKQQRLALLCEGAYFQTINDKGRLKKEKIFMILASNKIGLHFGEVASVSEHDKPSPSSLPDSFIGGDIKVLCVDGDSMIKDKLKKLDEVQGLAIGLMVENREDILILVASNSRDASIWRDGFRVLMGDTPLEAEAKADVEALLSVEMNLRMMDMQDVDVSELSPQVPELPTDFNFFYQSPGDESAA